MSFVNTVNPNGGVVYRRVMKNHFQTINYWNVFFRQKTSVRPGNRCGPTKVPLESTV